MNGVLSNYVLPLLGVLILILWLGSFFFKYGDRLKDKLQAQKIKGFGVDLEVSVRTLLLLVGLVLSGMGIYLQVEDYAGRASKAEIDRQAAERALESAQRIPIRVLFIPEGATQDDIGKLQEWEFEYQFQGESEPVKAQVGKGYAPNQFAVTLTNMTPKTIIVSLVLTHLPTNRVWAYRELTVPFEPAFTLKREH